MIILIDALSEYPLYRLSAVIHKQSLSIRHVEKNWLVIAKELYLFT